MADVHKVVTQLRAVFPDLPHAYLAKVVQQCGNSIDLCCDYIVTHPDPGPPQQEPFFPSHVVQLRPAPHHHQQASEAEAKSIAYLDLLAYQESLLRKAQEEALTKNMIAAMQLQDELERQEREERRAQEEATLELLEHERLERQIELESRKYECPICATDWTISEMYTMDGCDHRICLSCMEAYITSKLEARDIKNLPCPMAPQCHEPLSFDQVRHVLPNELFDRYDAMLLDLTLISDPSCRFCPRPDCGTPMLGDSALPMMVCPRPGCNFAFCFNCRDAWHEGTTCELYQQWKNENEHGDERFVSWARTHTRPCPNCHVLINKNGGCDHMYCTHCNHHFNWGQARNG